MPISKEKKVDIVKTLAERVVPAESIVFVNFHGLSVGETTELRKSLRAEGVGLMVAKKTLIKRALGASKITGDMPELDGEVALVYGDDSLIPAREVQNFAKTHAEHLRIIGGVFEGKYADSKLMLEVASIPGREVLLARLLNLFNSPIQRFAMVLRAVSEKQPA
ncbi:50S ribosomal protein L10 [Candidatus Nomurabacteria bacterium]|nr:50S ribosomal protein L10 [Candidatus Nomurabacteria bacterium]